MRSLLAQRADTVVTVTLRDSPFREALSVIETRIPFKFAFSSELAARQKNVTITAVREPLTAFLARLFASGAIGYRVLGDQIVLRETAAARTRITLSGYVRDARSGEPLIGASVYVAAPQTGILTDRFGFYSLTVTFNRVAAGTGSGETGGAGAAAADTMGIEVSYVGYKTLHRPIGGSGALSFELERNDAREVIGKVVVTRDEREDNVKKNLTQTELTADMIGAAPSVSGNGDVIGSVGMLPGVQAGMDGSTGFFVRGGNDGQNLVLLDDATLYNPSHIFGLVGLFNPPTVKYASLMKGGFPAAYGDYLSSVLDVVTRDGNNRQTGGSVQLGTVSSGATLYGPLQKDKSSYLLSARRSTTDFVLRPFLNGNYFSHYYFYDVNAKLSFQLTPRDRLLASFYTGLDYNTYSGDSARVTGIDYAMHFGNTAFTLRWNHQYSGRLYGRSSIEYNRYHQFLSATEEGFFAQLYSGIRDVHAKTELTWYASGAHKVGGGVDYLYQQLYPASLSGAIPPPDSTLNIVPSGIPPKRQSRVAAFVSDDVRLGSRWKASVGVRAPFFLKDNTRYFSVEPRVSLLYLIDASTSIKVSYTGMHQYLHLVQSYNASFPAEIWIGSSARVQPQSSQEITAGLFRNFSDNTFQTSIEGYYKQMGHQVLYGGKDTLAIDNTIEESLIFGRGWSYGAELFVRKNRGKWTGWLAYTLAYANQRFDSLNEGQTFPFAYDRRHMLDLSTAYALTPRWKVAANFLVASGRAFSLSPDSSYIINPGPGRSPLYDNPGKAKGQGRGNGGGRTKSSLDVVQNNYRLSPYNRLDLSVHYLRTRTVGGRLRETEWIFSVYNVYARANNSLVYRTLDPATRTVIAKQLPLIPVIPSLTFSTKF
ncbi:MAG TPA: TonB-dependent receptor plug domain-containing protein [Dinghuibacter sp.]|uniref:TonB-dependent receptor plug domain-containing protein n=1 Tax=Dinghuibacter sp. TaxID=2024697 RepID=UPI002C73D251|nr:TonB-dependent receptor plug domain-containing protein [Dinghuibacter sp.]HTJ11805.1 TonB-dependent receptor plug domain-containing protein [Dinghuibacter sp.]